MTPGPGGEHRMKTPSFVLNPLRTRRPRATRPPPGTAPGTLLHTPGAEPPHISVIGYGPQGFTEETVPSAGALRGYVGRWPMLWVNVSGVEHTETLAEVGDVFGLHGLALEDVADVPQRAKVEEYGSHVFVVARMAGHEDARASECTEQLSLFLTPGTVLTFQERAGDPLEPVRERLRRGSGRIRATGADYLTYAILDAVVDNYFPVLEAYADRLDALEEEILGTPNRDTMTRLHTVKRELMALRRAIYPMRDAVTSLLREPPPAVATETQVYLRDLHDHAVQAIDLLDTYREVAGSLSDLYQSNVSHRMNEVMKVLTMFSAVFIPLGFIAGVYGMNFDTGRSPLNMPELHWYWGYPFALSIMATVAAGLVIYFARKGWFRDE